MIHQAPADKPWDATVVWVTGSGAPRVGRTVAAHFASLGYRVALHARQSWHEANAYAQELQAAQVPCLVTQGLVEDLSAMQRAVDSIVGTWGRLDAVVHCAAVWDWASLEETTSDMVRAQFEVNSLGAFAVAKVAGLQMVQQETGGAVVLIGDWAVVRPYRDFSAYFVGKGCIETLVRTMAVELATRNPSVRVNGILPGPVLLDPSIDPDRAERIRQACLLKKHGAPEHVATAAHFLATHEFITGTCLPVDGGRTVWSADGFDRIAHPTYPQDREA